MLLSTIIVQLIPYKSLSYYRNYLQLSESISLYHNWQDYAKIHLIQLILLWQCTKIMYLVLAPGLTDQDRLILSDLFYLTVPLNNFRLFFLSILLMIVYLYASMYFTPSRRLNSLFWDVLFRKRSKFFIASQTCGETYRKVWKLALVCVNVLQIFIAILGI